MKIKFLLVMLLAVTVAVSSGCSSFGRSAGSDDPAKNAQYVVKNAPRWMTRLPSETNTVYAAGTAYSGDWNMSRNKAQIGAYGQLCVAANGTVSQRGDVFIRDSQYGTAEVSELAIRTMCSGVDISGAQVVETVVVAERNGFRTYTLVKLPFNEENFIRREREADQRSQEVFDQFDAAGPR